MVQLSVQTKDSIVIQKDSFCGWFYVWRSLSMRGVTELPVNPIVCVFYQSMHSSLLRFSISFVQSTFQLWFFYDYSIAFVFRFEFFFDG